MIDIQITCRNVRRRAGILRIRRLPAARWKPARGRGPGDLDARAAGAGRLRGAAASPGDCGRPWRPPVPCRTRSASPPPSWMPASTSSGATRGRPGPSSFDSADGASALVRTDAETAAQIERDREVVQRASLRLSPALLDAVPPAEIQPRMPAVAERPRPRRPRHPGPDGHDPGLALRLREARGPCAPPRRQGTGRRPDPPRRR